MYSAELEHADVEENASSCLEMFVDQCPSVYTFQRLGRKHEDHDAQRLFFHKTSIASYMSQTLKLANLGYLTCCKLPLNLLILGRPDDNEISAATLSFNLPFRIRIRPQ